jgi:hypothetical protein
MVDGLYSAVNFVSAIIAGRIALSVVRGADRRSPFGYDANKSIYITFRSLLQPVKSEAVFTAESPF